MAVEFGALPESDIGNGSGAAYEFGAPPESGAPPFVPEGRAVALPGRGTTFVREVAGPPGAPTLLLLHGWTATGGLNWFACFEPLGRSFRVIALDQRGHGRGVRSLRPFRLEDCADDVAALAEELNIDRLIPVGYSMGGPVAALVWRRHRKLVQGLVLCATARRFSQGGPVERVMAGGMLGLSVAASLSPGAARRLTLDRMINSRVNSSRYGPWAAAELQGNNMAALLQAGAALTTFDGREWLRQIDVPTAVVVTEFDRVVAPISQLALASTIPDADVFRVDGGHTVCAIDPDCFVPVLAAASASVARRARSHR
jgi:3-oxoadipate enol-lactonase